MNYNYHKTLLYLFLTALLFIGYPSCRCPQFYLMTGIADVVLVDKGRFVRPGEITTTDTLQLWITPDFTSYTDAGRNAAGTMATADALTLCSFRPVANHLESITVTSNSDFNHIPSGASLTALLYNLDLGARADSMGPIHLKPFHETLRFLFLEKPQQSEHTFTIQITDNAGNAFITTTHPVIWQ